MNSASLPKTKLVSDLLLTLLLQSKLRNQFGKYLTIISSRFSTEAPKEYEIPV